MDRIEQAPEIIDSDLKEDIIMVLSQYRRTIREKGRSLDDRHLSDIVKGFAFYVCCKEKKHVTMLKEKDACSYISQATGIQISGFEDWDVVSSMIQGLRTVSDDIDVHNLFDTLYMFLREPGNSGKNIWSIGVTDTSILEHIYLSSETVLIPMFDIDLIIYFSKQCKVISRPYVKDDLNNLTSYLLGVEDMGCDLTELCVDDVKIKPLSVDGAVLELPQVPDDIFYGRPDYNYTSLVKWCMDSLGPDGKLFMMASSHFCSNRQYEGCRQLLKDYDVYSVYRIRIEIIRMRMHRLLICVSKSEPEEYTHLYDMNDSVYYGSLDDVRERFYDEALSLSSVDECIAIEQSSFDWDINRAITTSRINYPAVALSDVAQLRSGINLTKDGLTERYDKNRPILIRIGDVRNGELVKRSRMATIQKEKVPLLDAGDVIVANVGTEGRSCVIHDTDLPCTASSSFTFVKPVSSYSPDYLFFFFHSSGFLVQCKDRRRMSIVDMERVLVPKADKKEQKRISDKVAALSTKDPEDVWDIFKAVLKM